MLSRELQLAMSPTPIITDAPLNATTGAGDAAGGGVRLTAGLHSAAASSARSGIDRRVSRMIVPFKS
jgi:hypothetical protein